MKALSRIVAALAIAQVGAAALAGDMLKPWASVIQGPDFPPGYHWTYESYEQESDCRKENAYQPAMKYGLPKSPVDAATPAAEPQSTAEDQPVEVDQPEARVQSIINAVPPSSENAAAQNRPVTAMGCVYIGSKSFYILKLRNWRNEAVLCIAKEKKLRDYRVVLAGRPRETEDYRCD